MSLPWKVLSHIDVSPSASASEIHQAIQQHLLSIRQIENVDEFIRAVPIDEDFLSVVSGHVGESVLEAVALIESAIAQNLSILIHGDYDVDGVSATAILWETLYYDLGYTLVIPFIPHRVDHGYGLSTSSIDEMVKRLASQHLKPGLLVTVDCGITAKAAVEYAKEQGFTVIVTDHHTLPESESDLPDPAALVHTYDLCGAGISWVVANTLRARQQKALGGEDLVALATLADVQSLTGFNRHLVKQGLVTLSKHNRAGLRAVGQLAGIAGKPIGTYEVGWIIAPRLNATGRLEHALDALRLLVVRNDSQANDLATKLHELNLKRQEMTELATRQGIEMVNSSWNGKSPIIVYHPEWHEGIIGLIASRLVGRFNVPAIAMAANGEEGVKGSARSVTGINVVNLLRESAELMMNVGGHDMAAGFSLKTDNVSTLMGQMNAIDLSSRFDLSQIGEKSADLMLNSDWINWELYELLESLSPHGVGNPRPLFASQGLVVESHRTVGKTGDHLKVTFANGLNAIGFGLGKHAPLLQPGAKIDALYTIEKDDYRGGKYLQLKLNDIHLQE